MVTFLSPTTIYQIFTMAAGADRDACIVNPGIKGVLSLLNSCLSTYAIQSIHIAGVYDRLRLEAECSFNNVEFEYLVNHLFCILQIDVDATVSTSFFRGRELLYAPRVSPSVGVSDAVRATRLDMLKYMSVSTGAKAERIVLSSWKYVVESSDPIMQAVLSVDAPPEKFWQVHLYRALFDVARLPGAELLGGNEFIPLWNFQPNDRDFDNTCFIAAVIDLRI